MIRVAPWIWFVTGVCFLTVTSCTTSVNIPPASHDDVEISQGKTYAITSRDGNSYKTHSLSRTDSTFVFWAEHRGFYKSLQERGDPIEIACEDVESLRILRTSVWRSMGLVLGVGLLVSVGIGVMLFVTDDSGWD